MADETYELIIKISPDGADEAEDALEGVNDEFEEAADGAEKSSGRLSKFASKWKGAMLTVVAGLAVAATGLLTQVPVIQDLMDGLGAIVESVALKLDEELRPIFEPLVEEMFKFAEQVDESDASLLDLFETLDSGKGARAVALERLPGIAERAARALERLEALAERFGISRFFESEMELIEGILAFGMDTLLTIVEVGLAIIEGDWKGAWDIIKGYLTRTLDAILGVGDAFLNMMDDMFGDWIQGMVLGFRSFWSNLVNDTKRGANNILDTIESMVNRAIRALNKLPGVSIGRVSLPRFNVKSEAELAREAEARRQQAERNRETVRNSLADREEIILRFDPPELARIFAEIQGQGVDAVGRGSGR